VIFLKKVEAYRETEAMHM